MRTSLSQGRLAFFPRYDDVMYLARGSELVRAGQDGWERGGMPGAVRFVVRDWRRDPPHAPWASAAAAIGFALFGYQEWAAYVLTGLPVLAMLLCAAKMVRHSGGRGRWRGHALVIVAVTAPFLAASVYILKPDYAAGIFAAIAMMKALRGPLLTTRWQRLAWVGTWFGLALLAKPAMMLPTGMLAGGTLAICTLRDVVLFRWQGQAPVPHGRLIGRICQAWAFVLLPMILVAMPHYALAWRSEWAYARDTLTGEGIEMWGYRGSLGQHIVYYLTGPGGRMMLDGMWSLVPLVFSLTMYGLVVFRWRGHYRSRRRVMYFVAVLAALCMSWAGPTLSIVKIQQFAACFATLFWLIGLHAAAGVCRAAHRLKLGGLRGPLVASFLVAGILATRLLTYRWTVPLWPRDHGDKAREIRDGRDEFVRRAFETVKVEANRGARSILTAGGQIDLDGPLLRFWDIRDRVPLTVGVIKQRPAVTDLTEAKRIGHTLFNGYDLLLVSRGVARTDRPKVIRVDADEFYFELAREDAQFELAARTIEPATGAVFELYRRKHLGS